MNSSGTVVYLVCGAERSFDFTDENGVVISLHCAHGDLVSMDGDLSSLTPCEVRSLPIGPNAPRGFMAITFIVRFEWSISHVCASGTDITRLASFPKVVPSYHEYGLLGVDVEAKESSISDAGFGLFLLRDFPNGGVVTEYEGPLRYHSKIIGKRDVKDNSESSHWRSVPGTDFVIVGISEKRGLCVGRGGASFANHKAASEANCKFDIIWTKSLVRPRFCEDDGCYYTVPRIVLTLLRPAVKGEEMFVDYGEETAKRFMNNSAPCPLSPKSPFEELHFFSDPIVEFNQRTEDESIRELEVVMLSADMMHVDEPEPNLVDTGSLVSCTLSPASP